MKTLSRFTVIYCATVIGIGLGMIGYGQIKSYTYVPEFHLEMSGPATFESAAICVGCKFEPWQNVFIGVDLKGDKGWNIHDINVNFNPSGIGGDIGGNCKTEPTVDEDDPQDLNVASIVVTH